MFTFHKDNFSREFSLLEVIVWDDGVSRWKWIEQVSLALLIRYTSIEVWDTLLASAQAKCQEVEKAYKKAFILMQSKPGIGKYFKGTQFNYIQRPDRLGEFIQLINIVPEVDYSLRSIFFEDLLTKAISSQPTPKSSRYLPPLIVSFILRLILNIPTNTFSTTLTSTTSTTTQDSNLKIFFQNYGFGNLLLEYWSHQLSSSSESSSESSFGWLSKIGFETDQFLEQLVLTQAYLRGFKFQTEAFSDSLKIPNKLDYVVLDLLSKERPTTINEKDQSVDLLTQLAQSLTGTGQGIAIVSDHTLKSPALNEYWKFFIDQFEIHTVFQVSEIFFRPYNSKKQKINLLFFEKRKETSSGDNLTWIFNGRQKGSKGSKGSKESNKESNADSNQFETFLKLALFEKRSNRKESKNWVAVSSQDLFKKKLQDLTSTLGLKTSKPMVELEPEEIIQNMLQSFNEAEQLLNQLNKF